MSESQAQTLNNIAFYTISGRTIHGQTREGIWAIIRDLLSCFDFYFVLFFLHSKKTTGTAITRQSPPTLSLGVSRGTRLSGDSDKGYHPLSSCSTDCCY